MKYYDLHIHSALSPCADDDMTVNNILNMAALKGLDVVALTDHNSCGNCAAFVEAAKRLPLIAIPGMELCTSEEIHAVCLFERLENALEFSGFVRSKLPKLENRPDIFGSQLLFDAEDNITGEEKQLLACAADISLDDVGALMKRYGGVWFPAHVDKPSYSVMSVYGYVPSGLDCDMLEIFRPENTGEITGYRRGKPFGALYNSDAHSLWQIHEREHFLRGEIPWLGN